MGNKFAFPVVYRCLVNNKNHVSSIYDNLKKELEKSGYEIKKMFVPKAINESGSGMGEFKFKVPSADAEISINTLFIALHPKTHGAKSAVKTLWKTAPGNMKIQGDNLIKQIMADLHVYMGKWNIPMTMS